MKIIDAKGKACPEPVMMTKAALDKGTDEIEIHVDNEVASRNVERFLKKSGYESEVTKVGEIFHITGKKGDSTGHNSSNDKTLSDRKPSGNRAVFISRNVIGGNDEELGEVLMKSFLGTLAQIDNPPAKIALMNEGIKLALEGTSSCEHLKELEKKGVEIFVCGTCSNHFGLTEKIGTGIISNMFDITEALLASDSVISI